MENPPSPGPAAGRPRFVPCDDAPELQRVQIQIREA
jgi:hypothetical protein